MKDELRGTINEVRKSFTSESGLTGAVEFGRTHITAHGGEAVTPFRVMMEDGRKGHGRYASPKSVRLTVTGMWKRRPLRRSMTP